MNARSFRNKMLMMTFVLGRTDGIISFRAWKLEIRAIAYIFCWQI